MPFKQLVSLGIQGSNVVDLSVHSIDDNTSVYLADIYIRLYHLIVLRL